MKIYTETNENLYEYYGLTAHPLDGLTTYATTAITAQTDTLGKALKEIVARVQILEVKLNQHLKSSAIPSDDCELGDIDDSLSEFIEEFDVRGDD